MDIYCAHPLTREYLGPSLADPDPLDADNWLIPAHAYLDAPPAVPAGQAAQRSEDGSAWLLVADHRGSVYDTSTGTAVQHTELGDLPDGLTVEAPPSGPYRWDGQAWVADLAAIHKAKTASISTACEAAINAGFVSAALGTSHSYSSQLDDQLNLTGAILRGLDMPYACRDEQDVKAFRLHTAEQLRQVGDDFTLYKLQLLQHANELKQQLDLALAAGDAEAMAQIRWEALQP
ncbi:TPA: hypothetical protein N2C41_000557 [Pseudomonas aeruginosa]|nr:hypothetical protein [Pseudomonas aeruginosa]